MIWYQGESNIDLEYGAYSQAFDLMQASYSKLFGYPESEQLPIIFTQLAAYDYGKNKMHLPEKHMEFADIQNASPNNRALISIYDVELTYTQESNAIHPLAKRPIGEKMAVAAQGLIYNKNDAYTAPHIKSFEIKDGSVYVSFNNVGDGLIIKKSGLYQGPEPIYGCTIAAENGIFTSAYGEIVNKNTIRIFNPEIKNPIAASYAYSQTSTSSNLFSSLNGEPVFGVSPFTTKRENTKQMQIIDWANCEVQSRWHSNGNTYSGIFPTWQASKNTTLSFNEEYAYQGVAALQVNSDEKKFSISPSMSVLNKYGLYETFRDQDVDYSKFKSISFMIKNNGNKDLLLEKVKIYVSQNLWFSPKIQGQKASSITIAPDGAWHKITLDLDKLFLYGKRLGLNASRFDLQNTQNIEICFSGEGNSSVLVDDFNFYVAEKEAKWDPAMAGSAFRFIFPAIQAVIDFFAKARYHIANNFD